MNNSSLTEEKTCLYPFVQKTSQVQAIILSSIIKQAKLKHNNVFMNKLVNTMTQLNYM